jgi:hypothetical protein
VIGLLLVIFLVLPLIFTTLIMIAINSWVLDRSFYVNLLDNPDLNEALLSQDLPLYVNNRWFPREINSDLPPVPLDKALREVMTPQYLRDQSVRVVNQAFDTLEGRRDVFDISMGFAPVKAALVLFIGLAINSPFTTGGIGLGLERSRYTIEGVQYSAALRQAIVEIASKALSAVAGDFLWSGFAAGAMAIGLIVWGATTRSEPRTAPPMVSGSEADVIMTS